MTEIILGLITSNLVIFTLLWALKLAHAKRSGEIYTNQSKFIKAINQDRYDTNRFKKLIINEFIHDLEIRKKITENIDEVHEINLKIEKFNNYIL